MPSSGLGCVRPLLRLLRRRIIHPSGEQQVKRTENHRHQCQAGGEGKALTLALLPLPFLRAKRWFGDGDANRHPRALLWGRVHIVLAAEQADPLELLFSGPDGVPEETPFDRMRHDKLHVQRLPHGSQSSKQFLYAALHRKPSPHRPGRISSESIFSSLMR